MTPFDRLGCVTACAVQTRSDVPSIWAGSRHGLDVGPMMIGNDLIRDYPGALDRLAEEGLRTGRVAVLAQQVSSWPRRAGQALPPLLLRYGPACPRRRACR
jgi:hypothetical protein